METYSEPRELVDNPAFSRQRDQALTGLSPGMIEEPIADLITGFNKLPSFFTLQCCYGHFVFEGQPDIHNMDPLPSIPVDTEVEYRIAYMAFCIDNSDPGKSLLTQLRDVVTVDPDNIQFCCADWFWEQQVNSFALQVEPERFKDRDVAIIPFKEAQEVANVRNRFFRRLEMVLSRVD